MLLRESLGEVLRSARMRRGLTLRELSASARVSLGYISEIERGRKEVSSELLAALGESLDLPLEAILAEASALAGTVAAPEVSATDIGAAA